MNTWKYLVGKAKRTSFILSGVTCIEIPLMATFSSIKSFIIPLQLESFFWVPSSANIPNSLSTSTYNILTVEIKIFEESFRHKFLRSFKGVGTHNFPGDVEDCENKLDNLGFCSWSWARPLQHGSETFRSIRFNFYESYRNLHFWKMKKQLFLPKIWLLWEIRKFVNNLKIKIEICLGYINMPDICSFFRILMEVFSFWKLLS